MHVLDYTDANTLVMPNALYSSVKETKLPPSKTKRGW